MISEEMLKTPLFALIDDKAMFTVRTDTDAAKKAIGAGPTQSERPETFFLELFLVLNVDMPHLKSKIMPL